MEYLQHFLYPSSFFASKEPYVVKTVLGSCVAVCLWDKRLHFGGINHYMLPTWSGKLIEKMKSMGSRIEDIQAKVFGGGELLDVGGGKSSTMIGERNIMIARMMLEERKIPVVGSSTGGKRGRKILFFTDTGEVRHKFLDKREL